MIAYRCFVRNWWRWETGRFGGREKVPNPGARRSYLPHARYATEEEAQARCAEWNNKHNPGPLSRKAEYESFEV